MKKLWVMALGSAFLLQTASLYAADIKFEGDFRVRGIYADDLDADEDAQDQQAFADGRFRLRTTATAGITTGVVTVDFTNAFTNPETGTGTGNYRLGTVNLGSSWNIIGIREAYFKLDLKQLMLAVGRKPVKLGHGLILDDTADTVAAKLTAGPLDIVLANAKLLETTIPGADFDPFTPGVQSNPGTGSDTDLYVIKAGLKHGDDHSAGVFLAYLNDREPGSILSARTSTTTCGLLDGAGGGTAPCFFPLSSLGDGNATLWVLGATADGKFGPLNLGLEIDILNGTIEDSVEDDLDLKGLNILVNAGLPVGPANVGVTLLYTSGDDADEENELNVNGISGNFVLGNILINDNINSDREGQCASVDGARLGSGGRDCIGGVGVTGIKLSAGLPGMPTSNCHTEVAAIWAQTTEDPINLVTNNAGDSDLGIEIDLNHKHKLDDNVAIAINLGYLISGDAWKTLGANPSTGADGPADNQIKGVVSLNYMF